MTVTNSATSGATKAITERMSAPPVSAVATAGFPSPPVRASDFARTSVIAAFVSPAELAPAMTAVAHLAAGGRSAITAAVTNVPASRANGHRGGIEQMINGGHVVRQHLGNGSGA